MAYDRGLQNRKKYALPVLAVTLVAALLAGAIDPANASRYTPIVAMLFFGVPFWFICKAYPKGVDIVPEPGDVGYEEWLETGK